jgi:hypothetical protein
MKRKPNFFIVGTPKSGTTSLFNYLEQHPNIFVPKIKEPHYFSSAEVENSYYKIPIINNLEDYLNLYKEASNSKAIGDFSTSYLYNLECAEKIKKFNYEAKIIILLRNPVDRAVSHYLMDYNLGYVKVSLMEILKDPVRNAKHYQQYVSRGFYNDQIKNYFKHYDKSNILIVLSDDFFNNPSNIIAKIFEFLEVNKTFKPNFGNIYNKYSVPKYNFVKWLKRSSALNRSFNYVPLSIKTKIKSIFIIQNVKKPELLEEKLILKELFNQDLKNTSREIKKDLKIWL